MPDVMRQKKVMNANEKLKMTAYMIEGAAIKMHQVADGNPTTYAHVHKMILNAINNLLYVSQEVANAADGVEDMFA